MNDVLLIIIMLVGVVLALFVIPRWRVKRALPQVVRIFRDHNAVSIKSAKTSDELGFRQQGITERMLKRRDYKPYALRILISADIVQITEDGRLYLSEEKLINSSLYRSQSDFR